MPEIIFQISGWWLLPIAIVSALLSLWLYNRSSGLPVARRSFLAVLRFLIFFTAGFLLLSPLLRQKEERSEKPILVWLEDHSASVFSASDSIRVRRFQQEAEERLAELEDKYRIQKLTFSQGILPAGDSIDLTGTNIEAALQDVRERFYNRNIGSVVMLSDGIYNEGSDPAFTAEQMPFPVHVVLSGDSTTNRDIFIERVVHNKVSYLNNEFPVEVYVRARGMSQTSYRLRIIGPEGEELVNETKDIESADHFDRLNYFIKADKEGFRRYTVILESSSPDESPENNRSVFSVEVLSNKKKILVLSPAPHPDIAALTAALNAAQRYEVQVESGKNLPADRDFDLLILHQPGPGVLAELQKSNEPYWLLTGEATTMGSFEPLTAGEKGYEESEVYVNQEFNLFSLSETQSDLLADVPPLWAPFGSPSVSGEYYPLLFKRLGRIKTTDPAWLFRYDRLANGQQRRSSITLGTGLWRWRMQCYRNQGSFSAFDEVVQKTAQFLTTRNSTNRFDVDIANRFGRSERILGEARLFNSSLELVNDPDAVIRFTAEDGRNYDFSFTRSGNTYRLNAGSLPPGIYSWQASTSLSDENFTDSGKLLVEEELRELSDLVARPAVMRKIATASGGGVYEMSQLDKLLGDRAEDEGARALISMDYQTRSLIEKKWLFAILLILLALEWGLRKYFGRY